MLPGTSVIHAESLFNLCRKLTREKSVFDYCLGIVDLAIVFNTMLLKRIWDTFSDVSLGLIFFPRFILVNDAVILSIPDGGIFVISQAWRMIVPKVRF